jgi:UPF0176 protein
MNNFVISAFYKFFDFSNYKEEKKSLFSFCDDNNLKGTILIANEGINSTISGSREKIDALYEYLANHLQIKNLIYKESFADFQPFDRMKVRLKKEIVTLGVGELDIHDNSGEYIEPCDWDDFISRDDVIVVDTRNQYEVNLGRFDKAIDPKTKTFKDFPEWVEKNLVSYEQKKIAMYCTGGIRCEKSTSYLKKLGFEDVYHLKGGILQYLQDTKNQNEKWQGSCFVFDSRVNLDDNLCASRTLLCRYCRANISTDDLRNAKIENLDVCLNCLD